MRVFRILKVVLSCIALLVVLIWVVNAVWFFSESMKYGGGTLNGSVRDGHYYLWQHGPSTEVSQAVWEDIRLHELGFFLGAPLNAACFLYLGLEYAFPWQMRMRRGEDVERRIQSVRMPDLLLASRWCSGSIAGVGLGFPLIGVAVYPDGITVRLALGQPVAIFREELTNIEWPTGRFGRWVKIVHTSPDVASPIKLNLSRSSDLAVALDRFMEHSSAHVP